MSVDGDSNREVFISYSSHDKQWADATCSVLENHRVRCWIAPRDIIAGSEWGSAIIEGIDASKIMLLIFSQHANESPQVRREVERALGKGLIIIPFRVEDVRPIGSLEYALSNTHWLDAFTPPVQQKLDELTKSVQSLLRKTDTEKSLENHKSKPAVDQPQRRTKAKLAGFALIGLMLTSAIIASLVWDKKKIKPDEATNSNKTINSPSTSDEKATITIDLEKSSAINKSNQPKSETEKTKNLGQPDSKDAKTLSTSTPVAEFIPLFNGKDLTGWEQLGSEAASWKVANKILIGTFPDGVGGSSILKSTRSDFRNFHLRVITMKSEGWGSRINLFTPLNGVREGAARYRISLGSPQNNPNDEFGRLTLMTKGENTTMPLTNRVKVDEKKWMTLDIIYQQGKKITVEVNGTKTADASDMLKGPNLKTDVRLYLGASLARFKSIEIKELP